MADSEGVIMINKMWDALDKYKKKNEDYLRSDIVTQLILEDTFELGFQEGYWAGYEFQRRKGG